MMNVSVLNLPLNTRAFVDKLSDVHKLAVFGSPDQDRQEDSRFTHSDAKSIAFEKLGFLSLNFIQNSQALYLRLFKLFIYWVLIEIAKKIAVKYHKNDKALKVGTFIQKTNISATV